jgi:hypothetical protein
MTTANVQIKKILVGRGNATISSNYAGVRGEVTMNTTTKALHVHDGVTTGGWPLATEFYVANLIASAGGVPGPQGPQGNIGAQGPQGIQGNVGPQGIQGNVGPQGIQGNTGAQGAQGIQGNVGATGATGPQGIQGNVGATGSQGPQGIQGNTGATGAQGIQGNVGATGSQGPQGSPGIQGNVGAQGIQGNVGATGSQGIQGNIGPQGPQGIQGQQGNTGAQGVSVTLVGNVATSGNLPLTGNAGDGYIVTTTGNLFFWNSNLSVWADIGPIVGPQGDAGPQGIQGNTGAQGSQGIQGNIGPQGPQGIQGNIGPQGPQGEQGIQGNIGPQGPQGIQGNVGATGPQGEQGIQGNVGATGPQGIQGNVGATGPQGPQGIQGNTGAQGSQGIQGNIGPQGIQGNVGAQGIQGNIGPQGPVGPAGSAANTGDFTFTHSNLASSTNANIRITTNGNAFVLGSNGNLFLPNNMSFVSSPAMATTGIVFGDGSYQNTAYTGAPVSQLINGVHTVILDSTGNLTVPSSILPTADNAYDLGSATMRFRHLYVGPGTVYIGNAAIKSTLTGNLIIPGLTRAVANTAYADEVYEEDDQEYSFATVPTVIDNARYSDLSGRVNGLSFTPAEYSVDQLDDDGYISGITITSSGSGYSDQVDNLADQDMWATEVATPFTDFNANDWVQIPFRVNSRAGESEYDFNTSGGSGDTLTNGDWAASLNDTGSLSVDNTDDEQNYFTLTPVGNEDASYGLQIGIDNQSSWFFSNAGGITFPDDTVQTTAYTGGAGGNIAGLTSTVGNQAVSHGSTVYSLTLNSDNDDNPVIRVYKGTGADNSAIAIGQDIGGSHRANVVAIGNFDVGFNSLPGGVYIGYAAGYNNAEQPQGLHAIAIGSKAAYTFATNNSITLNATGNDLTPDESGLFIKPIRAEEYDDVALYYNPTSGEVTYANNAGVSALVTVGNTASGTEGALWYNTEDGRTYVYALDTWIDASPAVVPGNMVGYGQDGNITLNEDARINYANGVSILSGIDSSYGDAEVAEFLGAFTGNIAKIGANPLSIAAASVRLTSDNETWTFAPDGVIALPNGMTIESYGTLGVNASIEIGGDDTRIRIDNNGAPPGFSITANATGGMASRTWLFGPDGNISFPDGSTQTTAYTGGGGGSGNALVNGGYTVALEANGVLTLGGTATISNNGEFRLWADNDITVYRNGLDGYGVKLGNIEVFTDNALRTLTNSNGFEIKTGNLILSGDIGQPNRGFSNQPGTDLYITAGHTQGCSVPGGDTIISSGLGYNGVAHNGGNVTLRTGDYYSKQWNFDYAGTLTVPGDIEFTSSTAIIRNVDVITVMDSVQSPVYRFVNGGKITGIGNNLNIQTTTGVPGGPVTKISDNQGWGEGQVGTNLPTTGGTGTGLTVDVVDSGSAYAGISINTPGSGYTNGDVLTVTNGGMSDTFSISVPVSDWQFGNTGITIIPSTLTTAQGNITIQVPSGIPVGVANWAGGGGWNQAFYSNIATTGGTGTGLTVDVAAGGGGYINIGTISINNPGSGYTDGDVITIDNENNIPGSFTVVVEPKNWIFSADGATTFPSNLTIGSNPLNPGTVISQANALISIAATGSNAATYIGWSEFEYEPGNIALVAFNDTTGAVAIQTGATTGPEAFIEWVFDADGSTTFPDAGAVSITGNLTAGNVETNGLRVLNTYAPVAATGNVGDRHGQIRIDSDHLYVSSGAYGQQIYLVKALLDHVFGTQYFIALAKGIYPKPENGWEITRDGWGMYFSLDADPVDLGTHWGCSLAGFGGTFPAWAAGDEVYLRGTTSTVWKSIPLNTLRTATTGTYANANVASYLTSISWTGVANAYVAIGTGAGATSQGLGSVAVGLNAGNDTQGYYSVAVGIAAGRNSQADSTVAIGGEAGGDSQGVNSVAIGYRAGRSSQASSSIILNATGANLNATTANTLTVAPIRNTTGTDGILQYNNTTKEVSYSSTLGGNLTVTGNITQQSAYYETYSNVTNSGGNLTCNFVNGGTFYATLTANVTVNFTNVVATAGRVTGATLIVDQGATAYRVANLQINSGGVQTIRWAGGTTNTGTASNTDIMSFSLISLDGTNWRVLGQISNYG